jgi:hypothetical protein
MQVFKRFRRSGDLYLGKPYTTPRTKFGGKKQPAKMDFTRQFKCRENLTAGRNLASAGTDTSRRSKQPARQVAKILALLSQT